MSPAGALLLVAAALAATGAKDPGEHLVAGANAFRDARYDQALVEFRVAESLGATEARGYRAATLVQLGRFDDAVEAFGAEADGDALLAYYHAIACYEARLYGCADRLLASVGTRSGPRVAERVARTREAIAAELAGEPPQASIDWYLQTCSQQRGAGRPVLALAFCREAVGLAERRADRYRHAEAASQMAALTGPGRPGPAP